MAEHSMRIAGNGELYTFSEFQAYYHEAAEDMWQRAWTPVTATERDVPPTLLLQSIPAPCVSDDAQLAAANPAHIPEHTNVHATERDMPDPPARCVPDATQPAAANPANIPEHTDVNATERDLPPPSTHVVDMQAANSSTQPAATEHNFPEWRLSRVVVLSLHDADTLRAAEAAIRPKRSLHKLARDALNAITKAGVHSTASKDLDGWFPWKEYIACHAMAPDIIGEGVTHAVAEFIANTRDGNRGGQPRLDFVVYRSDGTYCRLHPGSKQSLDAKPIFSPGMSSVDPATERIPAMIQWAALPQIPFTYDYCSSIPKTDQIGKKDAYRLLLQAPLGPLPITEDAPFKWWLFVCNLGKNTQEVIGPGLTAATLEHKSKDPIGLLFTRSDGTSVQLLLSPKGTRIV